MDKLRIIICDENRVDLEGYAKICRSVCDRCGVPMELKLYSNPSELLFDMKDDVYLALVSIMIVEPEGIFASAPATVRKESYDGVILYLSHSTDPEHYHQAFDADAYNFVQKGYDAKNLTRFQSVFELSLQAAKQLERQYIVVSCAGEYKQIEVKDIYYFEGTTDHMVRVEYAGGSFNFPSTLQKLEERLRNRGFARTHRSFIVAVDAVHQVGSSELILNNGHKIPVGRNYYASLRSAVERWQL
ncbi:MAG: LytTR family DNA-binding domain-containing protein [Oscillospiraceae bacterium]|nr:LytTR family DNA-binding domain-containing protein [Oscillospiraceae bacterium]